MAEDKGQNHKRVSAERALAALTRALAGQNFETAEEADQFLREFMAGTGGKIPTSSELTPAEQAQELVYDAWEADDAETAEELAKRALEMDPDCADAYLIFSDLSETPEEAREFCEKAAAAAERSLPPEYLTDPEYVGKFWDLLPARPYMRARSELGQLLRETGELGAAIEIYYDLLRLDPDDHQGLHFPLIGWLLEAGRDGEVGDVIEDYMEDGSALYDYVSALLFYRNGGPTEAARTTLRMALVVNPFVPILLQADDLPELLDNIESGKSDEIQAEAALVIRTLLVVWMNTPGWMEWLFGEAEKLLAESEKRKKRSYKSLKRGY